MASINNINDVRVQTALIFDQLKNGEIETKTAEGMNNSIGKIISSLNVELKYYAQREEKPSITFFAAEQDGAR